jgi:hypothetical protein
MNNQIEIIEVADHYINNLAQLTGTRAFSISQFIKANQLDAVKLAADLSRNATEERYKITEIQLKMLLDRLLQNIKQLNDDN